MAFLGEVTGFFALPGVLDFEAEAALFLAGVFLLTVAGAFFAGADEGFLAAAGRATFAIGFFFAAVRAMTLDAGFFFAAAELFLAAVAFLAGARVAVLRFTCFLIAAMLMCSL